MRVYGKIRRKKRKRKQKNYIVCIVLLYIIKPGIDFTWEIFATSIFQQPLIFLSMYETLTFFFLIKHIILFFGNWLQLFYAWKVLLYRRPTPIIHFYLLFVSVFVFFNTEPQSQDLGSARHMLYN